MYYRHPLARVLISDGHQPHDVSGQILGATFDEDPRQIVCSLATKVLR